MASTGRRIETSVAEETLTPHMAMQLLKQAASLDEVSDLPWSQHAMSSEVFILEAIEFDDLPTIIDPDMLAQSFWAACAYTGEIRRPTTAKM